MDVEYVDGAEFAALEAAIASAERQAGARSSQQTPPAAEPASPPPAPRRASFGATSPARGASQPQPPFSPTRGSQPLRVLLKPLEGGLIEYSAPYNQALIAAIKSVEQREYHPERRVWTFPAAKLIEAATKLHAAANGPLRIEAAPPLALPAELAVRGGRESLDGGPVGGGQAPLAVGSPPRVSAPPKPRAAGLGSPGGGTPADRAVAVTLRAEDGNRFAAEFHYHKSVVEACRSVSERQFDSTRKLWLFPLELMPELLKHLSRVADIQVEAIPPLVLPPTPEVTAALAPTAAAAAASPAGIASQATDARTTAGASTAPPGAANGVEGNGGPSCAVILGVWGEGRVSARFAYNAAVVGALKKVAGREYDEKGRLWHFPFKELSTAKTLLQAAPGVTVRLEDLQPLAFRAMQAMTEAEECSGRYSGLPVQLEARLMDFQREGVRFALRRGGRALIADEMGLGKTVQALAVAECFREEWPVLVVAPSSLRLAWAGAVVEWLGLPPEEITLLMPAGGPRHTREGFNLLHVSKAVQQGLRLEGSFVIGSYDMLPRLQAELGSQAFQVVVADEAHYLKNPKAQRTQAASPLLTSARRCILLSGTPALSRPIELFELLKAVQPAVYARAFHEYGKRYCQGGAWGQYTGSSHLEELNAVVKATAMVRRLKREVLQQLPPKRRQQVLLQLTDKAMGQIAALSAQLAGVRAQLAGCSPEAAGEVKNQEHQLLNKLYTLSAQVKVPAVQEYVELLLDAGCKFLIFGHHQELLDGIQETLDKKKVRFIRIDGQTPASKRLDLVNSFQNDTTVQVAVLAIRAAGLGLTLTAASTVVFAEMTWTPGDLVQAEDRAHRIGQADSVNVYYLHARDTIDDIIWEAVQHKLGNIGRALDGQEEQMEVLPDGPLPAPRSHPPPGNQQKTLDAFLQPCKQVHGECSDREQRPGIGGRRPDSSQAEAPSCSVSLQSWLPRDGGLNPPLRPSGPGTSACQGTAFGMLAAQQDAVQLPHLRTELGPEEGRDAGPNGVDRSAPAGLAPLYSMSQHSSAKDSTPVAKRAKR